MSFCKPKTILVTIILMTPLLALAQTTLISDPYATTISTGPVSVPTTNIPVPTPSLPCTNIAKDISSATPKLIPEIRSLQEFLIASKYLSAKVNGVFGPATTLAVKKYQSANKISATGTVGPITRNMIKTQSCSTASNVSTQQNNQTATPFNSTVTPKVPSANQTIFAPAASSSISTDTKFNIQWSAQTSTVYDILLQNPDGSGMGYIATNVSGGSYTWNVGHVITAQNQNDQIVQPGIYRIYLRVVGSSSQNVDQQSGTFTLTGRPLLVNSVNPNNVSNDNKSSVALLGSGFDTTSMIRLDDPIFGQQINANYISSDGKVLVFTMSSWVTLGNHSLSVYNTYASGATSTPSNIVNINIQTSQ